MQFRLTHVFLGFFAAYVLAAPAAHAFTMENGDGSGQFAVPKFDAEEQAKNFRSGSAGAVTPSKGQLEVPLGNGSLNFGVKSGSTSNFGSAFGPSFGPSFGTRDTRQDFERMVAPPNLRYFVDR